MLISKFPTVDAQCYCSKVFSKVKRCGDYELPVLQTAKFSSCRTKLKYDVNRSLKFQVPVELYVSSYSYRQTLMRIRTQEV